MVGSGPRLDRLPLTERRRSPCAVAVLRWRGGWSVPAWSPAGPGPATVRGRRSRHLGRRASPMRA